MTEGSWVQVLVELRRDFGNSVYPTCKLNAVGRFYLVSMPGEVKVPTQGQWVNVQPVVDSTTLK